MISEITRREGCRRCPSSIKEIDMKQFGPSLLELGRGTYGVVTLHVDPNYDNVVIKSAIPDKYDIEEEALKSDAVTEIATLSVLQGHPNIVKMIGFNIHPVTISSKERGVPPMNVGSNIVLESAVGSLADLINDKKISGDNELTKKVMYQVIRGMNWMHKNDIWHRDLKPQNILLVARGSTTEGTIAVTDFGLARSGPFQWLKLSLRVGTRWYKAPELYIQELTGAPARYGAPADIWSIGMVFWDILAPNSRAASYLRGDDPTVQLWKQFRAVVGSFVPETIDYKDFGFSGKPENLKGILATISKSYCKHDHPNMTAEQCAEFYKMWFIEDPVKTTARERFESRIGTISDDAWDLLSGLLAFNPKDRISMKDALAHKYFDSIRDEIVETQPTPKIAEPMLIEECKSITPKFWTVISRWLWDVKVIADVQPAAYFLCLHIMRCLLSHRDKQIEPKIIQLYAIAAMGLAVLYMEDTRSRFNLSFAETMVSEGGWSVGKIIEAQKRVFLDVGTKLHLPTSWVELMKLVEAKYSNEEITKLNSKVVASVLAVLEICPLSLKISASELAELAFDLLQGKIRPKHAAHIEEVQQFFKGNSLTKQEFPKELEAIIMNVKKLATVKDIIKAKPTTLKVPSRSSTIKRASSMMRATPFSKPDSAEAKAEAEPIL